MSKKIVTIGRQFGSGGREIGQMLADKLSVKCYDRTLISLAAKASGYDEETLKNIDEKAHNALFVPIPIAHYANMTGGNFEYSVNDKLFFVQSEIIRKIAEEGSAVIVGRCADYVLSERDDVLKVFIHADKTARIAKIKERNYLDEKSAVNLVNKTDKKRANYYRYYTGNKWADVCNYDVVFDSGLGYETIVNMILEAMK